MMVLMDSVPGSLPLCLDSLGTRPSEKSKRGSGRWAGAEVYTAPGMQASFRLIHDCMPMRIYWIFKSQLTRIVQRDRK